MNAGVIAFLGGDSTGWQVVCHIVAISHNVLNSEWRRIGIWPLHRLLGRRRGTLAICRSMSESGLPWHHQQPGHARGSERLEKGLIYSTRHSETATQQETGPCQTRAVDPARVCHDVRRMGHLVTRNGLLEEALLEALPHAVREMGPAAHTNIRERCRYATSRIAPWNVLWPKVSDRVQESEDADKEYGRTQDGCDQTECVDYGCVQVAQDPIRKKIGPDARDM